MNIDTEATYDYPSIGTGILQPNLKHKFTASFRFPAVSEHAMQYIKRETVCCKIDYLKKEVYVEVEQPASVSEIHDVLFDSVVNSSGGTIRVNTPDYVLDLLNCKCIEHNYDLDYRESAVATHMMRFEFSGIVTN